MIKILPLRLEYCEAVAAIAREGLPESWSLQEIRNVLQYDYNLYYVACNMESENQILESDLSIVANCIVGFAGAMLVGDEAELLNIAIRKAYRRQGIGTLLLKLLLREMTERGINRMLLEVRESNKCAQKLYLQHGFRQLAVRKQYYINPAEDALIMECIMR